MLVKVHVKRGYPSWIDILVYRCTDTTGCAWPSQSQAGLVGKAVQAQSTTVRMSNDITPEASVAVSRGSLVQVMSKLLQAKGGATTTLELVYNDEGQHVKLVPLSSAHRECLTLREKIAVMQHLNLFLMRLRDGGESGIGQDTLAGNAAG
jgi:hypothetical protein